MQDTIPKDQGTVDLESHEDGRHVGDAVVLMGDNINDEKLAKAASRKPAILLRLAMWGLFGVVFSWMPLGIDMLKDLIKLDGVEYKSIIGNGELFVISAVIATGAVGEVAAADFPAKGKIFRIVCGAICGLSCLANSAAYAIFSPESPTPNGDIATISLVSFAFATITSAFCIGLAAGR
ncbi:hypothetical protein [Streptacidiphilus carbonis]|uniref:hypothetical protein n=1 Tax=Streptacidiphilus carbonis TaxID=105422 RepID=UPI0012698B0E|nr:hypothetical protein [Streptacidiphilus carbonis]